MERQETFQRAQKIIDKRRQNALYDLDKRLETVYIKAPDLKKIEGALQENMFTLMKEMMGEAATNEAKLLEKQEKLLAGRKEILEALQISDSYLKPQYTCEICGDTGFVENKYCHCLEQALIDLAYDHANLEKKFATENFNTFDLSFYSQQVDPVLGISPYDNMVANQQVAHNFARHFKEQRTHLLLTGETGLGKTFLCNAMAKEILDRGFVVFYITAGHLFSQVEKKRFSPIGEKAHIKDVMETAQDADLLIIDDLGTEFSTTVTRSALFTILNDRMIYEKPVIISTNLSIEAIRDSYTDRIASRIIGEFTILRFFGDDIRVKKKYNL